MKNPTDICFGAAVAPFDSASDRREFITKACTGVAAAAVLSAAGGAAWAATPPKRTNLPSGADNFYTSDKVTVQKVTFKNQYQMAVAGTLFVPKALDRKKRTAAIVVGHPMGAVKEQSANLYATKMAEQGFVALSLDLAFRRRSRSASRSSRPPPSSGRWSSTAAPSSTPAAPFMN